MNSRNQQFWLIKLGKEFDSGLKSGPAFRVGFDFGPGLGLNYSARLQLWFDFSYMTATKLITSIVYT